MLNQLFYELVDTVSLLLPHHASDYENELSEQNEVTSKGPVCLSFDFSNRHWSLHFDIENPVYNKIRRTIQLKRIGKSLYGLIFDTGTLIEFHTQETAYKDFNIMCLVCK